MPMLECPIPEREWAREAGVHNGASGLRAEFRAKERLAGAGPREATVQKIEEFQHLEDDWDGFGAVAPSRELLVSAIGLAYLFYEQGVDPPHCVVPGLDGSVNLEWQDPDGTIAEVQIDRPLHAEVMVIEPGQPAKDWTLPKK